MAKEFQISFDSKGNQLSWEGYSHEVKNKKDNYMFSATLFYNGFTRGRSALNIQWKDENGKTYQSGMSLLDEALSGTLKVKSIVSFDGQLSISSNFTFKKQGTAILLTLAK